MTLRGCATPEATAAYAARFGGETAPGYFRTTVDGLAISSIGLGTYLGDPSDEVDGRYQDAIERALALGCNHLDTAVNYRFQRSERLVGRALRNALKRGDVLRDEVIVATKGGFVPFDGGLPPDPRRWVYEEYIEPGLAHANEFAATYQHCLAPDFLDAMIERSCENLGVETIDIYYLHNPETQRISNTHETFRRRMIDAFECLEAAVASGAIMAYGTATWTAYRSAPTTPDYVSLTEMMDLAYQVAGDDNHFRCVQMPYNLVMTEAFALQNQQVGDEFFSPIEAAQRLGLTVMVSATLKQGLLATPFMTDLSAYFPGAQTDAQKAVQFVRSTPGVASALVGMSRVEHVEENLALRRLPPIDGQTIRGMFEP